MLVKKKKEKKSTLDGTLLFHTLTAGDLEE